MKWVKCRDPKEWICDKCRACGGCISCKPRVMYHRGEESLCENCFPKKQGDEDMKDFG